MPKQSRCPTLSEFHLRPGEWPAFPYLPVKNTRKKDPKLSGFPLTGLMVAGEATVYDANLFDLASFDVGKVLGDYATVLDAELDGWIVD